MLFKNLEYRFPVERTNTEDAIFLYKTPLSEVNVQINKTEGYKNGVLQVTIFFSKILFQYKNLSWFQALATQMSIFILFVCAGILFKGNFLCEYP